MAEVAAISGIAGGLSTIFKGFSGMQEGKGAQYISRINAANLEMEGDTAYKIAGYNAAVARQEGQSQKEIADYNALLTKHDGDVAAASAEYQALQLDRAANEARAEGQQGRQEQEIKNRQVMSSLRARAASSGAGGVGTAGVMDIAGDIIQRGDYLSDLETFKGETTARGRMDQATAARASGEAAASRARAAAYGIGLEEKATLARGDNAATLAYLQGEAARQKAYSQAGVERMKGNAAAKQGRNQFIGSLLEAGGKIGGSVKNYYG